MPMPISEAITGLEELLAERQRIRAECAQYDQGAGWLATLPGSTVELVMCVLLGIYQNAKDLTQAQKLAEDALVALSNVLHQHKPEPE